jgi:HIRAN domain-containing protein
VRLFRKRPESEPEPEPEPEVQYDRTMGESWEQRDPKAVHVLKVGKDYRAAPANRTKLTGESHYQTALTEIAGPPTPGVVRFRTEMALLLPEPENAYDPNAVAVHIGGRHVGYLPRDLASTHGAAIASLGEDGKPVGCKAEIRGSGPYGVELYFDPDALVGKA